MSGHPGAGERITDEVTSWPGMTAVPGQSRRALAQARTARDRPPARRPRAASRLPEGRLARAPRQGRIDYHPVFPGKPGYAARRIDDGRGRARRDRAAADQLRPRRRDPRLPAEGGAGMSTVIGTPPELLATSPQPLPFGESSRRSYLMETPEGNAMVYSSELSPADEAAIRERGAPEARFLNHWHEAMFEPGAEILDRVPVTVGEADRAETGRGPRSPARSPSRGGRHARTRGDPDTRPHARCDRLPLGVRTASGACSPATRSTSARTAGPRRCSTTATPRPTSRASS